MVKTKKKKIQPNSLSMLLFVGSNYSRPLSLHWGINWIFMMIPRRFEAHSYIFIIYFYVCVHFYTHWHSIWVVVGVAVAVDVMRERICYASHGVVLHFFKYVSMCVCAVKYCDSNVFTVDKINVLHASLKTFFSFSTICWWKCPGDNHIIATNFSAFTRWQSHNSNNNNVKLRWW